MQFVNNEQVQIQIRKDQNTLIVVGTGTIIFGLWTMAKMLGMVFILRKETIAALKENYEGVAEIPDNFVFWGILVMTFIIMAVILAVRTYVGMSAISEGRGKRKGILYLLFAMIMVAASIYYLVAGISTVDAPEQMGAFTRDQSISALIIEATSMVMTIEMIVSALRIRKLTRTERHTGD